MSVSAPSSLSSSSPGRVLGILDLFSLGPPLSAVDPDRRGNRAWPLVMRAGVSLHRPRALPLHSIVGRCSADGCVKLKAERRP